MCRPTLAISERKYLKMCRTNGVCNLISIRRQKESADSKFVISCCMMHYLMWFKSYIIFTSCKGMHRRTDSHRDNSAHLRMVEFFFHCEAHQDVFITHFSTIKTQKISKKKRNKFNNKKVKKFPFFISLIWYVLGSWISLQPSSVFLIKPRFSLCMALAVGVTEIMNTATIAMLRLWAIGTCRAILKSFLPNTYHNAIFTMVNEIKSNNFLARLCGDR